MPDLLALVLFEENRPLASFMRKYHRAVVELRCAMQKDVLGSDQLCDKMFSWWGLWKVVGGKCSWDGLTVWVNPLFGRVLVPVLVLPITAAAILPGQRCQRCHLEFSRLIYVTKKKNMHNYFVGNLTVQAAWTSGWGAGRERLPVRSHTVSSVRLGRSLELPPKSEANVMKSSRNLDSSEETEVNVQSAIVGIIGLL